MKNKPVQYFTKEYLERSKKMTKEQIVQFLDDFQNAMSGKVEKCRLISMKIEPSLLAAFKKKAELEGIPYQKKIKQLMKNWL
ncbi:MAG: hypothetical protein ACK5MA_03800 [Parachlamydiaceae bacterium]